MAGITDVGAGLVNALAAIAYPNGTGGSSVTGAPVAVYQGWPTPSDLRDDLVDGKIHVSVWPMPGDKPTFVAMGDNEWQEAGNTGTAGTLIQEARRQTRQFMVSVWAARFDLRDPLADALDAGMSAVTRLAMPDGTIANVSYAGSRQNDDMQKAGIYRRDLMFAVNYATSRTSAAAVIQKTTITLTGGGFAQPGPTITINP